MDWSLTSGLLFVLIAGIMVGTCMTPLRFITNWQWEHAWLIFSAVSLLVIPMALAALTVPDALNFYRSLAWHELSAPLLFGLGWGIAQVLFGISVIRLGMALAFAIIVGMGSLIGTVGPVAVQHPEVLSTLRGVKLAAGTLLMLAGIFVLSLAGMRREAAARVTSRGDVLVPDAGYRSGLTIAIVSGLLASMLNYALAFGHGIETRAVLIGAPSSRATFAVWPAALAGGFLPNAAYSLYLLGKNRTWKRFVRWWPDVWFATLMGALWMGAVALYGVASNRIGTLGTSVGWALYQIFMILTANLSGAIAGEWRGSKKDVLQVLGVGLALLVLATIVLASV
jgi:L-rhamnose-H+ transport protein